LFALLTGYYEAPAGVTLRDGLHYNPYFPGGSISMARVLYDGLVEYEDGTPATASQMAKDVSTFLAWASEPETDDRKKMGMKAMIIISTMAVFAYWLKRYHWGYLKTRKLKIIPTVPRQAPPKKP
jgi:ubiquinol-cytochrome c reductase cytochrome c1 subunit